MSLVAVTTKPIFHDFFLAKIFSLDEEFPPPIDNLMAVWGDLLLCGEYLLSERIFVKKKIKNSYSCDRDNNIIRKQLFQFAKYSLR